MVFVVTIPLLSIVVFSVMAASLPLYKKVQSSLDTVLSPVSYTHLDVYKRQQNKRMQHFNITGSIC